MRRTCNTKDTSLPDKIEPKNPPRKAESALQFFSLDELPKLEQSGSKLSSREKTAAIRQRWSGLSAEQKARYEEMARNDKARYDQELKDYLAPDEFGPVTRGKAKGVWRNDIDAGSARRWNAMSREEKFRVRANFQYRISGMEMYEPEWLKKKKLKERDQIAQSEDSNKTKP